MENLFEFGTRTNLQFQSQRGSLIINDLWKLPETELQTMGDALEEAIEKKGKGSRRRKNKSTEDTVMQAKLDIIDHIIAYKDEQKEIAANALTLQQQRESILARMARKQDEEADKKSIPELQADLDEVNKKLGK